MVVGIWLARFLCRNRPSHRLMTAECCFPLGYYTPLPVEDGGKRAGLKFYWVTYWLSVGPQPSDPVQCILFRPELLPPPPVLAMARKGGPRDRRPIHPMTGIPLDIKGITIVYDSSASEGAAAEESADSNDDVVSASTVLRRPVIRRKTSMSSGPGALFDLLQRSTRSCSSVGSLTLSRCLTSNGQRTNNQLSDKADPDMNPFRVIQGDNQLLLHQINADIEQNQKEFSEDSMKIRYKMYVRPQLFCRGLILPHSLTHGSTRFIHYRTREIVEHRPIYMSCLDVMAHEKRMTEEEWQYFLKYMIKIRVYIVENWSSSLCHAESLMYDHGIVSPSDDTNVEFYKAECDASFNDEKKEARLSSIIWKGKKIVCCQVYNDLPCKSSVLAEAYAAIALMIKARELGVEKLVLWTDNKDNHGVLSGERHIKFEDKHRGVYMMMRSLKKKFQRLISIWKPRELNQFADDLVSLDKEITLNPVFPLVAMIRWEHQLKGLPIFRVKQKNETVSITDRFDDDKSYGGGAPSTVMLEVQLIDKFDCLIGLQEGFEPAEMYVAIYQFHDKPQDLQLKFEEFEQKQDAGEATIFYKKLKKKEMKGKSIMVMFDANLRRKSFHTCQLTVVLVAADEVESLGRHNMRKLSALDYAHFNCKNTSTRQTERQQQEASKERSRKCPHFS